MNRNFQARVARFMLALAAAAGAGTTAQAQQDAPSVISPLRVESDRNGVNVIDGRTAMDMPVLSVPASPNLRFDRVQNAAPYVSGRIAQTGPGEYPQRSYSVHTGTGTSESFQCIDFDCSSVTGTGSTFRWNSNVYRQAGSAAVWHFNVQHVSTSTAVLAYASSASYPNGESITYSYDTATLAGEFIPGRVFYRPNRVTSNLGYFISITYQGSDFNANPTTWATPSVVTLYADAAPTTPLGQLTYSGNTITDMGGRVYTCTGCNNSLGYDVEVAGGSTQLPGEGAASRTVVQHPSAPVVSSVTRDGVQWTYTYLNLRSQPTTQSWLYDRLTVDGPNSYHNVYNIAAVGSPTQKRNVMTSAVDSIGRATSYLFDEAYRPYQVVSPEGNQVNVSYDEYGNLTWRRTRARPGTGLPDLIETAYFPTDTCATAGTPIMCYRALWSRDALNRQTDYAYNALGQLTEQVEPADASGVRRRTSTTYEAAGLSRRSTVRVCADTGSTCGTNAPVQTEYEYWGNTFLPSVDRRVDNSTGTRVILETRNTYDAAGRLTVEDGPLAGTDDAKYYRYDSFGRREWEIGPRGPDGLRIATHVISFRASDDKPNGTETGTLPDENSTSLTIANRTDVTYDGRRYPIRQTATTGGTIQSVLDKAFDDQGRLVCTAVRMNPAAFGQTPGACALTTQGAQGPDRITVNSYDAAGQMLQEIRAYLTASQQNYATYTYSPNGQQTSVTDANNNRAEITYDGYDRQRRWIFPSPTSVGYANPADYEEYGYDTVGNRISLRKRDNTTITYQYDALNRMTAKFVPTSATGGAGYNVYYGYDLRNLQTYARFGSTSGLGITNAYDGFGRLASTSSNMDGVARALTFQYDAASNRTRITHPDGPAFGYSYDALARPSAITDPLGSTLATFSFDTAGNPSAIGRPGATTGLQFRADGPLLSLTHYFAAGLDVQWTFGRNPAGQITSRTRSNDAYASNTAYNVSRSYMVNGLNQYTVAGPASFLYDANGNLRSDGATNYVYDAENRLVSTSGASTVSFGYDPLGRLSYSTGNPQLTRFLYDGDALVIEADYSGNVLRRYVHGSNAGADDPLVWYDSAATASTDRRNLLADHQGSIVAVSDNAGNRLYVNGYDEWGIPNAANAGRFQYTGQTWLPEIGMYYYKARMYSPTLGRFLQADPVGYEGGINLYAYVGNDPMNATDPSGRDRVTCNIVVDGDRATAVCTTVVDESPRTSVTYNVTRSYVDAYGRTQTTTESHSQVFEGSISQESFLSRMVLGAGAQIVATIQRNVSVYAGMEMSPATAGQAAAMQAGHTPTPPGSSPVWRRLQPYRDNIKTDGNRYYQYDRRHGEIEVYDRRGRHLGTQNARTGAWEKPAVPGRRLDL